MKTHTFVIDWMGRPHLANAERRAHYYTSASRRKEWNDAAVQACRIHKIPKGLERIGIYVQPTYSKGPLPDPDAPFPTAKAIIDGLVAYGVIPDDSGKHVAFICLTAPYLDRKARDQVRVVITEKQALGG